LKPASPILLGNIRNKTLKETWNDMQESSFYASFKDRSVLKGKCGVCEYSDICGGCRTRAYAYTGDFYESDNACNYVPESLRE
jgi:radical SAM protein with 4Fe4S-binding SPASM domain